MTETTAMPQVDDAGRPPHGNAYSIFILVLTVFSLAVMVLLILPLGEATLEVLRFYDNAICVVFLIDFAVNLLTARVEARILHRRSGLARPHRIDPELRLLSGRRPVPDRSTESVRADHPTAPRQQPGSARPGHPAQPRAVRRLDHHPVRVRRAVGVDGADGPVREPVGGCQHHDRRRCPVVGLHDDHHRRLRRSVPGDAAGSRDGGAGHVRGRRDHRVLGQHPGQPPCPARGNR